MIDDFSDKYKIMTIQIPIFDMGKNKVKIQPNVLNDFILAYRHRFFNTQSYVRVKFH